jgi:secretion/DNA translocation related TadE-like protein
MTSDRGSATVWAALVGIVLCVVVGALFTMGQAVTARHRAGAAADLAALAAADHALLGQAQACSLAARTAAAQGARLLRCSVLGEIADVTAAVGPAHARSRAGPQPGVLPAARPRQDFLASGDRSSGPGCRGSARCGDWWTRTPTA